MPTVKRLLDVSIAVCALIMLSPLLLIAVIGIRLSTQGPIIYRARRIARDRRPWLLDARPADGVSERRCHTQYRGREFTVYKFRTMRVNADSPATPITAWKDPRVFPFGAWLRATKIDELPQLLNVIRGDMAIVGPRPEAPEIVRQHYTQEDLLTLQVLPGLTSPGSLYYYTHCEAMLADETILEVYVERLLPLKLALDRVYIKRATLLYDLRIIFRTIAVIVARVFGTQRFSDPPELADVSVASHHTSRVSRA